MHMSNLFHCRCRLSPLSFASDKCNNSHFFSNQPKEHMSTINIHFNCEQWIITTTMAIQHFARFCYKTNFADSFRLKQKKNCFIYCAIKQNKTKSVQWAMSQGTKRWFSIQMYEWEKTKWNWIVANFGFYRQIPLNTLFWILFSVSLHIPLSFSVFFFFVQ